MRDGPAGVEPPPEWKRRCPVGLSNTAATVCCFGRGVSAVMLSKASDLAAALGVSSAEVTAARRVESSLSVAASGMEKAARNRHVAEQLGLTVAELESLRRLLNGDASCRTGPLVDSLRRIALMRPVAQHPNAQGQVPATQKPAKQKSAKPVPVKQEPVKPRPASSQGKGRQRWRPPRKLRAERIDTWTPETNVFVTDWGDRVHWRSDGPGLKAFGKGGKVVQAKLADPVCAGRSACEVCFGEAYSGSEFAAVGRLIDRLHGRIRENQPVRKQIAAKARTRFGASAPKAPASGTSSNRRGASETRSTEGTASVALRTGMVPKVGAAAERVNAERRAAAEAALRRNRRQGKAADANDA